MNAAAIVLFLRRCQVATRDFVFSVCRSGGEWTARKEERAAYSAAFRELTGREPTTDELDTMTGVTQQEVTR